MAPRNVQDAFYRVVHDFGAEKLASMMGMPPGMLYHKAGWCEAGHNQPTLADGVLATLLTGDKRIAQAFCLTAGGLYYDIPDFSGLATDALLVHLARIQNERGHFCRDLHDGLMEGRIGAREYAMIEEKAHEWIAVVLGALARVRETAGGSDE